MCYFSNHPVNSFCYVDHPFHFFSVTTLFKHSVPVFSFLPQFYAFAMFPQAFVFPFLHINIIAHTPTIMLIIIIHALFIFTNRSSYPPGSTVGSKRIHFTILYSTLGSLESTPHNTHALHARPKSHDPNTSACNAPPILHSRGHLPQFSRERVVFVSNFMIHAHEVRKPSSTILTFTSEPI